MLVVFAGGVSAGVVGVVVCGLLVVVAVVGVVLLFWVGC